MIRPDRGYSILKETPVPVEYVSTRRGKGYVDLARIQMITHGRDLYAFMHADPADVRIFSFDHGIEFIGYGLKPERRSLLEATYIFLICRNGVPIGYTQASTLLDSSEINFNVFDNYRGIEASRIFLYTLAMVRQLFKTDTFIINTQQLGDGNEEALQSGAFWFYHKHCFKPSDGEVAKVLKDELKHKRAKPDYRSARSTLKKLARSELQLNLNRPRETTVSNLPIERIGLKAGRLMEAWATASDAYGEKQCTVECAELLGFDPGHPLTSGERIAWQRWSPVVLSLPNVARWGPANKQALADIICAKGGKRESDYVRLFDQHKLLQKAPLTLGAEDGTGR